MSNRFLAALPVALGALSWLGGCDSQQLPNDSTLSITPPERSYRITERRDENDRCLFDVGQFVDVPIVLALRDSKGSPIGGVDVSVYVDFAANTFASTAPLALYEDRNSNGIVDADSELVSAEDGDIARVALDAGSGSRMMLMRVNLSCAYRSEIFAYVDGTTASAAVEVTAQDILAPSQTNDEEPT